MSTPLTTLAKDYEIEWVGLVNGLGELPGACFCLPAAYLYGVCCIVQGCGTVVS